MRLLDGRVHVVDRRTVVSDQLSVVDGLAGHGRGSLTETQREITVLLLELGDCRVDATSCRLLREVDGDDRLGVDALVRHVRFDEDVQESTRVKRERLVRGLLLVASRCVGADAVAAALQCVTAVLLGLGLLLATDHVVLLGGADDGRVLRLGSHKGLQMYRVRSSSTRSLMQAL